MKTHVPKRHINTKNCIKCDKMLGEEGSGSEIKGIRK